MDHRQARRGRQEEIVLGALLANGTSLVRSRGVSAGDRLSEYAGVSPLQGRNR